MLFESYKGKKVFITGHTGFKGSWLTFWLSSLGADIMGYALAPDTEPSMFKVLGLESKIKNVYGDVRNDADLEKAMQSFAPEIIFHLAAQPLVRLSYSEPVSTYTTNVIGTLNVLEAARKCPSVKAFVNVTTDKCYENQEVNRGYREHEPMGGHDMYSSSKGCVEIMASSYRRSFLNGSYAMATARAGNVIGGGDWAKDRLIPDCVRSFVEGKLVEIRNPKATRPWQHVLEPLAGYLILGQKLLEHGHKYAQGYNIGPEINQDVKVCEVAAQAAQYWGAADVKVCSGDGLHEATLLQLDITKAKEELGFEPVLEAKDAIKFSIEWYKEFYGGKTDMNQFTANQIEMFVDAARAKNIGWSL